MLSALALMGLAIVMPSAAMAQPRTSPIAARPCASAEAANARQAQMVSWTVTAPDAPRVGDALQVSWRAPERFPAGAAVYLAFAIPGEARFDVSAAETKRNTFGVPQPALPGFLALPSGAPAPLGIQFGAGKTRVLIPLHLPGSKLAGAFSVRTFAQGALSIEAAVVARTQCGERLLTPIKTHSFALTPGAPEIVVQDPYDLEIPPKALLSDDDRYLIQAFDGRYRVFEVATGIRLVDRNGYNPNFSPTSRFVVADIGDNDGANFEVIDLLSREVIATPIGSYIGWAYGDAWLIDGRDQNGYMTLRPTLISRSQQALALKPVARSWAPETGAVGGREDGLQIEIHGSCHACRSWTDTNMTLDLDRGVAVLSGEQAEPQIFELASGHSECCKSAARVRPYLAKLAPGGAPDVGRGWHATQPILFSQLFDPLSYTGEKWWDAAQEQEDWYRAALSLRGQLRQAKTIDPNSQARLVMSANGNAASRQDWRATERPRGGLSGAELQRRTLLNLAAFGVFAMTPFPQEALPFSNSPASDEFPSGARWGEESDRIAAEIAQRTRPWEERLVAEFPALKDHISKEATANEFPGGWNDETAGNLSGKKFNLDGTLEGLWRWEVDGRPIWLMQLLTIDGSAASGFGSLILLNRGMAGREAITSIGAAMPEFWSGAYGQTQHQTRIKPQLFANGYLVAASVASGTIAVYDIKRGQAKAVIRDIPQRDLLQEVQLSGDGRFVIQINSDGQFFLHRIEERKLALSGRVIDNEIIVYTPEGYYWSSYEGAHFVQLRFPGLGGLFTFQQFSAALSRPDIVKARIESDRPLPAPQLTSPPELTIRRAEASTDAGEAIMLEARSPVGLARLRFYHDGRMVQDLPVTGGQIEQRIALPPAGNARRLTALAIDSKGFVSTQSMALGAEGARTGKLYSVIVGIDRYADEGVNLRYARSDASRLGAALGEAAPRYYAENRAALLLDEGATAQSIEAALEKAVSEAEALDTIVFSFAGHGVQNTDGRYYLTPSEFRIADIAGTGLSWSRLAAILERSRARVVVILDSCHSGLSGSEGLATNDGVVQALLSGARAPMLVLAASKGRELAFEDPRWEGGVFTYALTEILRDGAATHDLDKDGAIEASELYRGLRQIVTRETSGRQSPWLVRQDLIGDFALF